MAISKYGEALCGYGVVEQTNLVLRFCVSLMIYAESKSTSISKASITRYPQYTYERCFVVYDSEDVAWKEYFTGLPMPEITRGTYHGGVISVDEYHVIASTISVVNITECTAREFAEKISHLSDEQIRERVRRIYALQEEAKQWSDELDRVVQSVREERERKESEKYDLEAKLKAGFGKYGKPDGITQIITAESQEWIKQGRCACCGGAFRGFFMKHCEACGKPKSY